MKKHWATPSRSRLNDDIIYSREFLPDLILDSIDLFIQGGSRYLRFKGDHHHDEHFFRGLIDREEPLHPDRSIGVDEGIDLLFGLCRYPFPHEKAPAFPRQ